MRKIFLLLFSMMLTACDDKTADNPADQLPAVDTNHPLLIFGGTILTMDTEIPTVSAMVILDGRIKATGSQTVLAPEYPNAKPYDLNGRTIIPGIIDSHVHVYQLGSESIKANLVGAETVAEMVTSLQAFYPTPSSGEWLIGQGWDEGAWASKGYPDRSELDAAFPHNPVLLQSLHGFAGFYNGAALAAAGVDADTPDPEVGQILRRENGEPTGVFLTLARNLVEQHAPPPTLEQVKAAIIAGLQQLSKTGVTTIHEAGMTPKTMEAFRALADDGALPVRVYGLLDGNNHTLMNRMFKSGPIIDPSGFFTVRGIKVFYDGSLGSRTALLRTPYSDKPDEAHPTERISIGSVFSLAEQAAKHGFQMAVHTIGDEGNDRILKVYKSALDHFPPQDHRWRLEHAQVVLPDYYEQVADMGIISSMQPSHAVGDSSWAEDRLGPDRIKHAYAWRSILDAGGRVVFNSDLPGEPWEPMQTLYFATTRQKLDEHNNSGWYTEQTLTVEESLKAMTSDAAFASFQEAELGKLKPGFIADFIELSANPQEVALKRLKDIKVIATWLGGEKLNSNK